MYNIIIADNSFLLNLIKLLIHCINLNLSAYSFGTALYTGFYEQYLRSSR